MAAYVYQENVSDSRNRQQFWITRGAGADNARELLDVLAK